MTNLKQYAMHPFATVSYVSIIIPAFIKFMYREYRLSHTSNLDDARRVKESLNHMAEIVEKHFRKIDPERTDKIIPKIRENAAKFLDESID